MGNGFKLYEDTLSIPYIDITRHRAECLLDCRCNSRMVPCALVGGGIGSPQGVHSGAQLIKKASRAGSFRPAHSRKGQENEMRPHNFSC